MATALFHASDVSNVASWLTGSRSQMLTFLWLAPGFDWIIVALLWSISAVRNDRTLATLVLVSTLIPLFVAVGLIMTAGLGHPGVYLLILAAALASLGAMRM